VAASVYDEQMAAALQARRNVEDKQAAEQQAKIARQRAQDLKDQKKRVREAVAIVNNQAREVERRKVRKVKEAAKAERGDHPQNGGDCEKTLMNIQNEGRGNTSKCLRME